MNDKVVEKAKEVARAYHAEVHMEDPTGENCGVRVLQAILSDPSIIEVDTEAELPKSKIKQALESADDQNEKDMGSWKHYLDLAVESVSLVYKEAGWVKPKKETGRIPCPKCKGGGLIEVGILRGGVFRGRNIDCPQCEGSGRLAIGSQRSKG